jgi:CRISPR-associated protein Csh2
MSQTVDTRTEILFVYDITDANPNGDPNDENRPRMDVDIGRAKVSDVRLKRTIRDYLHEYLNEEIFCREIQKPDGTIQQGKDRAEDFFTQITEEAKRRAANVLDKRDLIQRDVLAKCIDVRLFGATIPVSKLNPKEKSDSSVTLTGAVQFAMGTSLHRVEPKFIKGTGAFASGEGAQQKTFREEYILPYALITFYGIVNQKAAVTTLLSSDDAETLYKGIWYGTKNLITRSKLGQRPLLLLLFEYTKEHANSYIGRLDRFLKISKVADDEQEPRDEALRDVSQITLNLGDLGKAISERKAKISKIRYAWDQRLKLSSKPENGLFLGCAASDLGFQ